jgi:DNA primase
MLIAFDSDTAGRKAAIRSHSILRPFTWKLHSVSLDSKDPAEIMQLDGSVTLRTILNERRQPLSAMVIDARIDTWERRLRDPDGPYQAMISGASLIAELLPPDSADQIRVITQNREIQTIDELLRPVYSSELSQIAPILPADTAYQIARIADRLGCDACDVLAEVANTITRRPHPPKGPGVTQLPSPGDIESACPPTAAQLARTSFPRSPAPAQVNTACSARRPAPSVNRSRPARTTRFRA